MNHPGYTIRHKYVQTVYLDPYCKKAYPNDRERELWEPRGFAKMPSDVPRVYWSMENAKEDIERYAQRTDDWEVVIVEVRV